MADPFETFTKFIQSPPGQLAAGAALGGIIYKFFEKLDAVSSDATKLETAVWLLDLESEETALEGLIGLLLRIGNVLLGEQYSLRFWLMIALLTTISTCFLLSLKQIFSSPQPIPWVIGTHVVATFSFVYLSLAAIHYSLLLVEYCIKAEVAGYKAKSLRWLVRRVVTTLHFPMLVFSACCGVVLIGYLIFALFGLVFRHNHSSLDPPPWLSVSLFVIMIVSSIPVFLFFSSIFLLKVIVPFAFGFDWFNRHFDIEKKPLQSIGFVAGSIVAVIYWSVALLHRLL